MASGRSLLREFSLLLSRARTHNARNPAFIHAMRGRTLTLALVVGALYCNVDASQRGAHYFGNYAHALLSPLPKKSLLLINYDQQWTSIRCDAGAARRRGTFRVRAGPNSTHPRAQVHASV